MRGSRRGLVYASVQRGEDARSALDQHWAQGVVMAADLVLVPDPPEADDDVLGGLHLLVTAPGSGEGQRVALRALELLSLDGRGVCAALTPVSRVTAPRRPTQPSSPAPLAKALEADGSIWPVLRPLVPDGSGRGSDAGRFLDGLPGGLPTAPGRTALERTDRSSIDDIAWSICRWVPWCQPDGPP